MFPRKISYAVLLCAILDFVLTKFVINDFVLNLYFSPIYAAYGIIVFVAIPVIMLYKIYNKLNVSCFEYSIVLFFSIIFAGILFQYRLPIIDCVLYQDNTELSLIFSQEITLRNILYLFVYTYYPSGMLTLMIFILINMVVSKVIGKEKFKMSMKLFKIGVLSCIIITIYYTLTMDMLERSMEIIYRLIS